MSNKYKHIFLELISNTGIVANGNQPYDIQVHNNKTYQRIIKDGVLGLGESYMDGWWDCEAVDQFICKLLLADLEKEVTKSLKNTLYILKSRIFNLQNIRRAFQVGKEHYDIGNDLYKLMLDKRMLYTCGYWKDAKNLNQAQEAKLDLICKKINLQKGMTVLDLGCGFGSFAKYAAQKYKANVTGVTVSVEQAKLGCTLCKGLPVKIVHDDYRNITGKYDRVISIGIMEHIGYKNYRTYMKTVKCRLKDDGYSFFHTIGGNLSKTIANPWVTKYIFPNGSIPSIAQLAKAMEGLFIMEDLHNFGEDYDRTLMAWYNNLTKNWHKLKNKYNERFFRMFKFYLLTSAAAFRSRDLQLWQIVMTHPGTPQPQCRFS